MCHHYYSDWESERERRRELEAEDVDEKAPKSEVEAEDKKAEKPVAAADD
jgi:hypothetical protein